MLGSAALTLCLWCLQAPTLVGTRVRTMCRPSACAVNEQASLVWVSVYESSTLTRASVGELRPLIEGALAAGR